MFYAVKTQMFDCSRAWTGNPECLELLELKDLQWVWCFQCLIVQSGYFSVTFLRVQKVFLALVGFQVQKDSKVHLESMVHLVKMEVKESRWARPNACFSEREEKQVYLCSGGTRRRWRDRLTWKIWPAGSKRCDGTSRKSRVFWSKGEEGWVNMSVWFIVYLDERSVNSPVSQSIDSLQWWRTTTSLV